MPVKLRIREHVANPDSPKPYIQNNFDLIDLMTFLLGDITFGDLFNATYPTVLPGLIVKAKEACDEGLLSAGKWRVVDQAANALLELIQQETNPLKDVPLKEFYCKDLEADPDPAVQAAFEKLHVIDACGIDMTFLHQDDAQRERARRLFEGKLLNPSTGDPAGIGDFGELDLFTRAAADHVEDGLYALVHEAKKAGILKSAARSEASKINDMACKNNNCETLEGYFCSMTTTAPIQCTIDSDPWPE